MSDTKKNAVAPVKVVARKIVASGSLPITGIERSKQYADDFFIITGKKATSVHAGLTLNDQKSRYGEGGSFIVGERFIESLAIELGVPKELVPSYLTPKTNQDLPSTLNFEVEERTVGQVVHDDRTGLDITYEGNKNASKVGEVYFFPTNFTLDVSPTALVKAEAFLEKKALTSPVVEFLPRRRQRTVLQPAQIVSGSIANALAD